MWIKVAVAAAAVFNAHRDYGSDEAREGERGMDLQKRGEEINTTTRRVERGEV